MSMKINAGLFPQNVQAGSNVVKQAPAVNLSSPITDTVQFSSAKNVNNKLAFGKRGDPDHLAGILTAFMKKPDDFNILDKVALFNRNIRDAFAKNKFNMEHVKQFDEGLTLLQREGRKQLKDIEETSKGENPIITIMEDYVGKLLNKVFT